MDAIKRRLAAWLSLLTLALPLLVGPGASVARAGDSGAPLAAEPFANAAFQRTWERTDRPLSFGQVTRSWYWGPNPNSPGLMEQYAEGVGGQRLVQYFDKSRMEINDPNANPNSAFYVTNGLLTVELISGQMQVGNHAYVARAAANIPLASDTDDSNAPTYVSFQGVSNTTLGDHPAPSRVGQAATATIDKAGQVGDDPGKASVAGTQFAYFEAITKHNIPQATWDFLNLSGPIYDPGSGQNVNGRLSDPWYYTTGLPISEPYWAKVKIAGQQGVDVMIQAFERRVVTYVPSAPSGFKVQMSNIGRHYYDWRYGGGSNPPAPTATPTPVPNVPTPTPTPAPPPAHSAAQFVGTWLNDDANSGSMGKLWIKNSGNNLTVHWFGVCTPTFCDNEEKTAAYSGEPFNITLDGRPFSLSLVDAGATKLQLLYQGNQTIFMHRATPGNYAGTWLNNNAATGSVAKLWISSNGSNLTVQWFGACGGSLCVNESKTAAYNYEPFEITLDGRVFNISLDNLAGNALKVLYQGTESNSMRKVQASDYSGIWTNTDPNTGDIVRLEISNNGNLVHVHWYGACSPTPCDNGSFDAKFGGEPLVVNASSRVFTMTFDNAAASHLKVVVTGAPGGDRTDMMQRQ